MLAVVILLLVCMARILNTEVWMVRCYVVLARADHWPERLQTER